MEHNKVRHKIWTPNFVGANVQCTHLESTDAATGKLHRRPTRGVVADAAAACRFRVGFLFCFLIRTNSRRFAPIQTVSANRNWPIQTDTGWFRPTPAYSILYWPIQADTGWFRLILALNQVDSDGLSALCLPSLLSVSPLPQSHSLRTLGHNLTVSISAHCLTFNLWTSVIIF